MKLKKDETDRLRQAYITIANFYYAHQNEATASEQMAFKLAMVELFKVLKENGCKFLAQLFKEGKLPDDWPADTTEQWKALR